MGIGDLGSKNTEIIKSFYRPDELATILDEPVRNVYTWIRTGKIRAIRIGKCYKIHQTEVDRLCGNPKG